uniref:Transposase n=1 Tax=Steinernema glaseri TaxID=37863 RepID=A0A1I8AKL8_9BILA
MIAPSPLVNSPIDLREDICIANGQRNIGNTFRFVRQPTVTQHFALTLGRKQWIMSSSRANSFYWIV